MREWTIEAVADRFADAAQTAHRLPSAWPGGYVRFWPDIARTARETYVGHRLVLLPASPAQVDRFLEATRWLRWLTEEQRHLVWARAQHRPWKPVCERLHCSRATAWRRWHHALAVVVVHLNREAPRIVRGDTAQYRSRT